MFQEVWNYICSFFVGLYRVFVYKETTLDKPAVYILMFIVIGILLIYALGKKSGKNKALNSPFLFVVAIALTIFTFTY